MSKLLILSGRELLKLLQSQGFYTIRQKGSHVSIEKGQFKTVIPMHESLARGTLLGILKQCGLSREDLLRLIK